MPVLVGDAGPAGASAVAAGGAMPQDDTFLDPWDRLGAGKDAAARALCDAFTGRLIALARRHLDGRLRHKIDPEDVVQSAYKSFFLRFGDTLPSQNPDGLWGLLTLITLRKCSDRVRYFRTEGRDAAREAKAAADAPEPWRDVAGREPTPEEAACLAETVEALLRGLDPDERPIVELSLQGYSTLEISDRLGRAERSVRRLRERVQQRLERMQRQGLA
jgi:RNA polymerase sigma-70 factor (ECF subfamily)